jgi:hypothetical protein
VQPYLNGNFAYLNHSYILENFKPTNPTFHNMKRFSFSINLGKVVIEHAFGALENSEVF